MWLFNFLKQNPLPDYDFIFGSGNLIILPRLFMILWLFLPIVHYSFSVLTSH